jgi:hypothetical protein
MSITIAHHNNRAEAKATTTFDHFGDSIDLDDALLKFEIIWIYCTFFRHPTLTVVLKLQSRLARPVCQRPNTPMILKPASVEHHLRDARLDSPFGHQFANRTGLLCFAARAAQVVARLPIQRRCRNQGIPCYIIDNLGVNVHITAKHTQARTLHTAGKIPAYSPMPPLAQFA